MSRPSSEGTMPAECLKNQGKFAYILVTPVKNEEENLPALIQSIADQDLPPAAWFIIDDASNDQSPQIINQATSKYPWIHPVKLDANVDYDIGKHYASVCITGFDRALAYCEQNKVKFEYIALSDADMLYPKDYFTNCINFLRDNTQFGIVSGRILVRDKGTVSEEESINLGDGAPRGTGRVWRKDAFLDTGGYVVAKSPDTISNVKALSRGWKIKRLPGVICYQTRYTGEKPGPWSGYLNRGERAHYLHMTPLSILNAVFDIMFISRTRRPVTKSLALLSGYLKAVFGREERLEDEDVRRYFGSYKRVLKNYWLFLKGLGNKRTPG
jgi:glycosyltransferase involved in cell wall biosynthesis